MQIPDRRQGAIPMYDLNDTTALVTGVLDQFDPPTN